MPTSAFSFATAGEIRFGRGVAQASVPALAAFGSRVLLVTGADPSRALWLSGALSEQGVHVTPFAVPGEPDVATVEAGVAEARKTDAEAIVAIGGGAAIDAGKAIAALAPARRPMLDHLEVVGKGLPLDVPPLPFAALPTTSGTGAEVTRNAVITVPEARRKASLRDHAMLPRLAIVDPALTDSCPRGITLASGLDAITQVIEPYVSTRANPMTDALCRAAIPEGLAALTALMDSPSEDARNRMAWVSLSGGLALANAGLGVIHGLAGPLGGLTGAPHGAICGALLPHGLALNATRAEDPSIRARFEEVNGWIAAALDCPRADALNRLAAWSQACGLPRLTELGIPRDAQAAAADAAASSSSMKANPADLSPGDLCALMERAG